MVNLLIGIAVFVQGSLLLWMLSSTKGSWLLKLALTVLIPVLSFGIWQSTNSFSGWPTSDTFPSKSLFVWGQVQEPNPQYHDPGAIYLWVIPPKTKCFCFKYNGNGVTPRAFKLPYTRQLHRLVLKAIGAANQGQQLILGRVKRGKGKKGVRGTPIQRWQFRLYQLPPPSAPTKKLPPTNGPNINYN